LYSHLIFLLPFLPPPSSPLFPYTTLFRSRRCPTESCQHRSHAAHSCPDAYPAPRSASHHVLSDGAPHPAQCWRLPPNRHGLSPRDRKSTRLNSSHVKISYAVFCLKKKNRS